MKITCDFCNTEYNASVRPGGMVRCAICGNSWTVAAPARNNSFLVFFSSLCALLSAIVFVVAIVVTQKSDPTKDKPLVAQVTGHDIVTREDGVRKLVVSGTVKNQTMDIYGVPDLVIVLRDGSGHVIHQQKFMPTATLLDAGGQTVFKHVLSAPVSSQIKSIDVELLTDGGQK